MTLNKKQVSLALVCAMVAQGAFGKGFKPAVTLPVAEKRYEVKNGGLKEVDSSKDADRANRIRFEAAKQTAQQADTLKDTLAMSQETFDLMLRINEAYLNASTAKDGTSTKKVEKKDATIAALTGLEAVKIEAQLTLSATLFENITDKSTVKGDAQKEKAYSDNKQKEKDHAKHFAKVVEAERKIVALLLKTQFKGLELKEEDISVKTIKEAKDGDATIAVTFNAKTYKAYAALVQALAKTSKKVTVGKNNALEVNVEIENISIAAVEKAPEAPAEQKVEAATPAAEATRLEKAKAFASAHKYAIGGISAVVIAIAAILGYTNLDASDDDSAQEEVESEEAPAAEVENF